MKSIKPKAQYTIKKYGEIGNILQVVQGDHFAICNVGSQ